MFSIKLVMNFNVALRRVKSDCGQTHWIVLYKYVTCLKLDLTKNRTRIEPTTPTTPFPTIRNSKIV